MVDFKVGSESGETTPSVPVPTYNPDDPYDCDEEREELNDFIFQKFFSWTGVDGTFSTWRERHIFLRGFRNGFDTELTGKFIDCPAMWKDEAQYYEGGQEFGYVAHNAIIFGFSGTVSAGIALNGATILSMIGKLFGAG